MPGMKESDGLKQNIIVVSSNNRQLSMCRIIDSEIVLKLYFKKYPSRRVITYQHLREIRYKAEPAIKNVYIDITYSSIRAVKYVYPDSISIESQCVRIIGPKFRHAKITDMAAYHELEAYL